MSEIPGYVVLNPEYVISECDKYIKFQKDQIDAIVADELGLLHEQYKRYQSMNKLQKFLGWPTGYWDDYEALKKNREEYWRKAYQHCYISYEQLKHAAQMILEKNGTTIMVSVSASANFDLNNS